jgi:hypothetical protein
MARRLLATLGSSAALACSAAPTPAHTDQTDGQTEGQTEGWSSTEPTQGEDERAHWHTALELGTEVGALYSVWGPSADDLYAVGGQTLSDRTTEAAMLRFDGTQWHQVELPADTPKLHWVFGVQDARFIVGDDGVVMHRRGDDDAVSWTRADCGTQLPLWGVWGSAPDDVWIVGGDGFHRPPVLCHHDGTGFTPVSPPELSVRSRAFFKVWGFASTDVWLVGHLGVILHYDGSTWVEQPSGTGAALISLWGTSPDEVLAVGGHSDGVLARFDGAMWTSETLLEGTGLNGTWMGDDGDALVVGAHGLTARVTAGTLEPIIEESDTRVLLHAVFSVDGRAFAVGGSIDEPPPWTGIIRERGTSP